MYIFHQSFRFFVVFMMLFSGYHLKSEKTGLYLPSQDTFLTLKVMYISTKNHPIVIKNCADKVVETICELNDLYLKENITFALSDTGIPDFMLDSVLNFPENIGPCRIFYDKDYIDKKLLSMPAKTVFHKRVPAFSKQIQISKPVENATVYYKDIQFSWEKNPEIDHFLLDVATDAQFTNVVKSMFVFGNQVKLEELNKNEMYYWRLKPLHRAQYCQEYRAEGKFFTVDIHVKTMSLFGISLYTIGPTTFFVNNPEHKWYTIEIESLEGKIMSKIESNASHKIFDANEYQPGHYFVKLRYQKFDNTTILTVR